MTDRRHFYDGIAGEFDELMNRYDLERRLEVMFDDLLGGSDLRGALLLDAGCGTGEFSVAAMERGATVVAVDIGPRLLARTRSKGVKQVAAADVAALPFATGTFDIVVSSECIEHTPSPRTSVMELARVLRPGGRLAVTCPNRTWYWSCVVADRLRLRHYRGLENWPGWFALRSWIGAGEVSVTRHRGLHLFPFMLSATHPLLRWLDRLGGVAGPLYVNQCISGTKL
ncbi:MAG TPA: class I SAM-dependent methyltransferase [Gemmatimonadaceae bacterium]|nr:class I SAM-dependent methyltransferase [Gemmatimonadaceae bacterium]